MGKLFVILITFLVCTVITISTQRVMYTGYQAHRFVPETEDNLKLLKNIHKNNPGVIFLRQPGNVGRSVDMVLPPHLQGDFFSAISKEMPNSVLSQDLEADINHEANVMQLDALDDKDFPFDTYWNFDKMVAFCKSMESLHPDKAKIVEYGTSEEGRSLFGMMIANKHPVPANKPIMCMDAGMHAREWIGPMVASYMINDMLTNPSNHPYLDNFAVMVIPCANPDGFTYAWNTNRLWRKNRTPNSGSVLPHCSGVDPNRNYDFGHGGEGASSDQCSEVYHGEKPFSIPETRSFADWMLDNNMYSYTSLHSYSQMVLLSYGCPAVATSYPEMEEDTKIAQVAINALKNHQGTEYTTGNSNDVLYPACGTSTDWALKHTSSKFAYTYELRDTGDWGFVLPASQITPTCIETVAALTSMNKQMAALKDKRQIQCILF